MADIAKNDKDSDVRIAAIENLTDQNILSNFAKNDANSDVRVAAAKKITNQDLLFDIAKNGNYTDSQYFAVNSLDEQKYYNQIIEIINQNKETKRDLAAIGALKIIPSDKILKNNYKGLIINVTLDYGFQKIQSTFGGWYLSKIGELRCIIEIKTEKFSKSFRVAGADKSLIKNMDFIVIDINGICEDILSHLSKDVLLKISNESDVVFLRETAKSMLQN